MYRKMVYIFMLVAITILSACSNQDASSSSVRKEAISSESEQMTTEDNEAVTEEGLKISNSRRNLPQTGMTEAVPSEYLTASEQQGSVVRVDYDSKDYVRDSSLVTKTAYVYLPYG